MDTKDNRYKILQLAIPLIEKYNYQWVNINNQSDLMNDQYLVNPQAKDYQLIRITLTSASNFDNEKEMINLVIQSSKTFNHIAVSFLDIHINNEKYNPDLEEFPYVNIEENYHDGVDISNIFPELYNVVKESDDPYHESEKLSNQLMEIITKLAQNKPKHKDKFYVTYGLMIICTILYLLKIFLCTKYDESAVLIFLGADYMTFTKGLYEFYRFITCGLLHGSIIHLISDIYSLFVIGRFVELRFSHLKTFLIFLICTAVGSISHAILSENTLLVGLSSAIYGMITIMILDLYNNHMLDYKSLLPLIGINLLINFLPNVAWQAHLGGLISGYLLYLIFTKEKKLSYSILLVVMLMCLLIKYLTISKIDPLYIGTDMEVVKIYSDLGLKSFGDNLMNRLLNVYSKFGG